MKTVPFVGPFAVFIFAALLIVMPLRSGSVAQASQANAVNAVAETGKPPVGFAKPVTYGSGGEYAVSISA